MFIYIYIHSYMKNFLPGAHDYCLDYCYHDYYSRRHDHRSAALLRVRKKTDYYRISINRGERKTEIY